MIFLLWSECKISLESFANTKIIRLNFWHPRKPQWVENAKARFESSYFMLPGHQYANYPARVRICMTEEMVLDILHLSMREDALSAHSTIIMDLIREYRDFDFLKSQ